MSGIVIVSAARIARRGLLQRRCWPASQLMILGQDRHPGRRRTGGNAVVGRRRGGDGAGACRLARAKARPPGGAINRRRCRWKARPGASISSVAPGCARSPSAPSRSPSGDARVGVAGGQESMRPARRTPRTPPERPEDGRPGPDPRHHAQGRPVGRLPRSYHMGQTAENIAAPLADHPRGPGSPRGCLLRRARPRRPRSAGRFAGRDRAG